MLNFKCRSYRLTVSNVRTCQFLNWNCLKPYAALRLAHDQTTGSPEVRALSFRERMREEAARSAAAELADPWRLTLERVRGKIDFFDRLERISSQTLLDMLEVPQCKNAGTLPTMQRSWPNHAGRQYGCAT